MNRFVNRQVGRPADRQQTVLDDLRRQIVERALAAGSRLPSRLQLARKYRVSPVTVHRAMDKLKRDGLIRTRGLRGTFVATTLPHLTRYALVLPFDPHDSEGRFTLWHQALNAAAAQINQAGERHIAIFHGWEGLLAGGDIQRLADDVAHHRLAGLIFPGHPHWLAGAPELNGKDFYHVAITETTEVPGVITIHLDMRGLFGRALDELVGHGRRRIAALLAVNKGHRHERHLRRAMRARQLDVAPYWLQYANPRAAEWAAETVQLLLSSHPNNRPDALLILDDNLTQHAMAGLAATGLLSPRDVEVVSLANFPVLPKVSAPVRWVGFDQRAVLERACAVIDAQRRGEDVSSKSSIRAVFEEKATAPSGVSTRVSDRLGRSKAISGKNQ